MMTKGTPAEWARRRRLAVQRLRLGYTQQEVANFFDVHPRSVQRWMQAYREGGMAGLKAKPHRGRPPRLSSQEERQVLQWFRRSPREFGFPTDLWSAPRVADLIQRQFGKKFHPHYLNQWLAERRITPQKPERQARERDDREVRRWLREDWPRIKKSPGVGVPILF
jgi:transposase